MRNSKKINFLSFVYSRKICCHIYINISHNVLYSLYNLVGIMAKSGNDSMVIQFASINVSNNIRAAGGRFDRARRPKNGFADWRKSPVALARYFFSSRLDRDTAVVSSSSACCFNGLTHRETKAGCIVSCTTASNCSRICSSSTS